ncbi:spore germination protein [Bacillus sp. ISL-77]|uniref:spore germination protein n=1 Tax=Bacillus sp. ISL-77 TaxID=2819138 RepID=UPI001BEC6987|nr:spore germination protein [Bacillus sp. ISL-77]MBT2740673.1 spore germination protein [Bacillus sp. ISL-77]
MKTRIPSPIKKLVQDKQDEKLKKQQNNHDQSGLPSQDQNQIQEQEQDQDSAQNQEPSQPKNKSEGKAKEKFKIKKQTQYQNQSSLTQKNIDISSDLTENIDYIKKTVGNSTDIVIRQFQAGQNGEIKIAIIFTDGLTNSAELQDFVLNTLMFEIRNAELDSMVFDRSNLFNLVKTQSLPVAGISDIYDFQKLFFHLLSGDSILFIDGYSQAISISLRHWADRGVQEPSSQTVVRGPKDGFTETLRKNTALIRRRIKDPNLWIETQQIGTKTQTDVAIMYLKGVANDKTVAEVQSRLNRISIDAILESSYIEELIQDKTYTPFPTVYNTERPDAVAAAILEGRIAILVDGTPFVLVVPALFVHFLQASEDYYQRADIATLIRLLRYISFFLALLTPSLFIAVTTFHQEMLPTQLLISLASQREGVPFPALVEALMMELTFEVLREAGVRLPRAVGSSISIVGALVIGQAAVEAGIISASMVIIVSLTAISSFVSPNFNMSISVRILRFLFMLLAASFGLVGIILGLIVMVLHLNSLRSFGVPYLAPFAPFILKDQKDSIIRMPHWSLFSRPRLISQKDIKREDTPSPKPSN